MDHEESLQSEGAFKAPALPPEKLTAPPKVVKKNVQPPAPTSVEYSPPCKFSYPFYLFLAWSRSIPSDFHYTIEVIKNGQIIETIDLKKFSSKNWISIGRFAPCDIIMDHPSVSRHHAVLQYGALTEGMGWYIYDMDSTHGTKLNK